MEQPQKGPSGTSLCLRSPWDRFRARRPQMAKEFLREIPWGEAQGGGPWASSALPGDIGLGLAVLCACSDPRVAPRGVWGHRGRRAEVVTEPQGGSGNLLPQTQGKVKQEFVQPWLPSRCFTGSSHEP